MLMYRAIRFVTFGNLELGKLIKTLIFFQAIRKLQKTGHLPPNQDFFRDYAKHGQYHDVR